MKKIFCFVILIAALGSCSEDVKFNNQAVFQGVKDNLFWRGQDATAIKSGNVLTISARTIIENMSLKVPVPTTPIDPKNSATHVKYPLGTSLTRTASYDFVNDIGEEFFYETAIGVGDGEVVVSEYDGVFVSGTFRFNAINTDPESDGPETVNVQHGTFYRIPVVSQ